MASKHIGKHTVVFQKPPVILAEAVVVGKKEAEGPLSQCFPNVETDEYFGKKSWEQAESELLFRTVNALLSKAGKSPKDIDYILSGDLQAQSISSGYGLRELGIPFFGVYGACSTMAETLSLGAMLVDGGYATRVISATSSHFCSAEKQFRFPLDYGGQRPPTAQWTVTGSGAVMLGENGVGPHITHVTTGVIQDYGITDANHMGAAMAPAFVDTLCTHFEDTGRTPKDYDLILSGDLGVYGRELAITLCKEKGLSLDQNYQDCGMLIYDRDAQDVHAGGSGCGCSASVLTGYILPRMRQGTLKRVLFLATGALMNTIIVQQKESIPGIAHAVSIEA